MCPLERKPMNVLEEFLDILITKYKRQVFRSKWIQLEIKDLAMSPTIQTLKRILMTL